MPSALLILLLLGGSAFDERSRGHLIRSCLIHQPMRCKLSTTGVSTDQIWFRSISQKVLGQFIRCIARHPAFSIECKQQERLQRRIAVHHLQICCTVSALLVVPQQIVRSLELFCSHALKALMRPAASSCIASGRCLPALVTNSHRRRSAAAKLNKYSQTTGRLHLHASPSNGQQPTNDEVIATSVVSLPRAFVASQSI